MTTYIIDTETTGNAKEQEQPGVIELAYARVMETTMRDSVVVKRFSSRLPITPGAMSVHHIIPSDLEGLPEYQHQDFPSDADYIIGHNIDYDWKALGSPPVRRICTLAMARRRWEEEKGHGLGACLYRILDPRSARVNLKNAHTAEADVENCFALFYYLLEYAKLIHESWPTIWDYSEECRLPRKWTFGKHEGKMIGHELAGGGADTGYHGWCLRQPDMDEYLKRALVERRWARG